MQAPCRRCQLSGTPCIFEKPVRSLIALSCYVVEPQYRRRKTTSLSLALAWSMSHPFFPVFFSRRIQESLSPRRAIPCASISCCQKSFAHRNIHQVMQSHMIGMQSSLDRILALVQNQAQGSGSMPPPSSIFPSAGNGALSPSGRNGFESGSGSSDRGRFPPLPGFAPPVSFITAPHNFPDQQSTASQICYIWDCSEHCSIVRG